jgi:hypothetical protein
MRTFVSSQLHMRNSYFRGQSNLDLEEIKAPLSFPLLIIMFPLLIVIAFAVALMRFVTKHTPMRTSKCLHDFGAKRRAVGREHNLS